MKIFLVTLLILTIILGGAIFFFVNYQKNKMPQQVVPSQTATSDAANITNPQKDQMIAGFQAPLTRSIERVSKKPFGIFISPQNSPVQPEKFHGYHTGADFEIFPEEADTDVAVHAVCAGRLKVKEYATGYGGVAVQGCIIDGQPITVVYGHLKLASITAGVGDSLNVGDTLGILGRGYSAETDGERKHLHLGFHKGLGVDILGYVQNQSELGSWIDPCNLVCRK